MEEEPPKRGGVDGVCVGFGDGVDGVGLEAEEVGLVALFEMSSPGGAEVWWVVACVGNDEWDSAVPEVVGASGCVIEEVGGADVGLCGGWCLCVGRCVGRGVVGGVVLCEFVEGAEEACWGGGACRVAAGVDIGGSADCLVGEVEGVLVVVMVEVS